MLKRTHAWWMIQLINEKLILFKQFFNSSYLWNAKIPKYQLLNKNTCFLYQTKIHKGTARDAKLASEWHVDKAALPKARAFQRGKCYFVGRKYPFAFRFWKNIAVASVFEKGLLTNVAWKLEHYKIISLFSECFGRLIEIFGFRFVSDR